MKNLIIIFGFITTLISFSACDKKDDDKTPIHQQVVMNDTSQYTGSLKVYVKYMKNGTIYSAPGNTIVTIYGNYQDINSNLYLYRLFTDNSGYANFGYLNLGNYYVTAQATIGIENYSSINALQIRPRRDEELTTTMNINP